MAFLFLDYRIFSAPPSEPVPANSGSRKGIMGVCGMRLVKVVAYCVYFNFGLKKHTQNEREREWSWLLLTQHDVPKIVTNVLNKTL